MNIRYIFMAGAITGSLALASQASDHKIIPKDSTSITHFTENKNSFTIDGKYFTTPKKELRFIEHTKGTIETTKPFKTIATTGSTTNDNTSTGKKIFNVLIEIFFIVIHILKQFF
ncbi:hypothetical protein [Bartonella sp. B17]